MAVPVLRGCLRIQSTFGLSRLLLNELSFMRQPRANRVPFPSPAALAATAREFSSEKDKNKPHQKVVLVGITNPFVWFRTRIYYFLIRAYFDKDFNIEEFTEGAKQAFSHVSRLLSQCQFEDLEGLVAKDLIGKLKDKCSALPSSHKRALSADSNEIMYTTTGDVGIYYDDDGRKFVSILMRFWYMTNVCLPEDSLNGIQVFQISEERDTKTKRLLSANYEFQREFTRGVLPDWTITRIEHSKLLD